MKKDLVIYLKNGEILNVNGANDSASGMGTEKWLTFADTYGRLYMVDAESVSYIEFMPRENEE